MALKNYLTDGSYSIVDNINYSKQTNYLRFQLKIFSDSTKQLEMASKNYELARRKQCRKLKGFLSAPPENALIGDFYCVKKGVEATGAWSGREGLLAVLNEKKEWEFWMLGLEEMFYVEDKDKYYLLNAETQETVEAFPFDEFRVWDKWFKTDLVFNESNLYRQIYTFLKTLKGFEKVIDA
jgi:hypothetical protein